MFINLLSLFPKLNKLKCVDVDRSVEIIDVLFWKIGRIHCGELESILFILTGFYQL